MFKCSDGTKVSFRAFTCPKFKSANYAAKIELLNLTKKKVGVLCKHCSAFTHKSDDCMKKFPKCNQCKEDHITNLHNFQTALNCSLISIMAPAWMSLQDIAITEGSRAPISAHVLFDNRGQIALA